jgi:hypothetical protein
LVLAGVWFLVVAAGCSDGPETVHFDKVLPSCDALPAVLTGQGMPAPSPAPTQLAAGGTSIDCAFAAPAATKPPAISYVYLLLQRPNYDGFDGKTVPSWGKDFGADATCAGTAADDGTLPGGKSCYSIGGEHEGTGTVTGFAEKTGVRVIVRWTDGGATPDTLRADTLAKADAVAAAVAGML